MNANSEANARPRGRGRYRRPCLYVALRPLLSRAFVYMANTMIYREAGQFKTSYAADQAIFPIRQDRWSVVLAALAVAFLVVPAVGSASTGCGRS